MPSNTYLLINHELYRTMQRKHFAEDRYDMIRMVAKYLEVQNIRFIHEIDSLIVYPRDRYEMVQICEHFGFRDVTYFDGRFTKVHFPSTANWHHYNFTREEMYFGRPVKIPQERKRITVQNPQVIQNETFKPFIGNFIDFKPRLGLFGPIECAVQGSFLK